MIEQDTTANEAEGRTTISRRDAFETLHRARLVLGALEAEAQAGSYGNKSHDAFADGRAVEALDLAGDAVFNALNILTSYVGDPDAAAAIDRWSSRDKITIEPKAGE